MFIIDVQGFNYGNFSQNFICKEIAILNVQTGESIHKFVEMPHTFDMFNKTIRNHMGWLLQKHHGLEWTNNCPNSDYLCYATLSEFIKNIVQDEDILIKGLEKKLWLNKLISNGVVNVEDEGCPNFAKLKTAFKSQHCNQHKYNNLSCALENVNFINYWNSICKK
jgi:hypothetical protein